MLNITIAWEVSESLDIDLEVFNKCFRPAQADVDKETANGEKTNYDADIEFKFMDYTCFYEVTSFKIKKYYVTLCYNI